MQTFVGSSNQCKAFIASLFRHLEVNAPISFSVRFDCRTQRFEVMVSYLNESSKDFPVWYNSVVALAAKAGVSCFDPNFIEGIPSSWITFDGFVDLSLF